MLAEHRKAGMSELPEVSEFVDLPTEIDTSQPHIARMYDYYLGGQNHFAADRELADKVIAAIPGMRTGPRENREFLGRTVRYLAGEAGIRQFLDIGTGLPTTNSVHEVAQQVAPSSRVVYVDNDRCKSGCAHAPSRSDCLATAFFSIPQPPACHLRTLDRARYRLSCSMAMRPCAGLNIQES
jgi:hypothetical protein